MSRHLIGGGKANNHVLRTTSHSIIFKGDVGDLFGGAGVGGVFCGEGFDLFFFQKKEEKCR